MPELYKSEVLIVGGGITGLAAAYIAAKAGKKVCLIEASDKFGGLLTTFEVGGNRLEHFYHHFFTHDAEIHWLLNELEISHLIQYKKTSMGVFSGKKSYPFNSFKDLLGFKPIKFIDKIKFGLTSLYLAKIASWKKFENKSSLEWFRRWAGKSTTKNLWEPMLNIKFGPYKDKVPLTWMVGRMRQRLNSRKKGEEKLGYLNGSLQVLCDALVSKLTEMGVQMHLNTPLSELDIQNGSLCGILSNSKVFNANQTLITIPGNILSGILNEDQPLKKKLNRIKYFGVYCLVLELSQPLSNYYWLNIADKGYSFGGIIEHTNFINSTEYQGKTIVYLSRYFALEEPIARMEKEEIKNLMLNDLHNVYPKLENKSIEHVHVFRANAAAPVVDLNYAKKVVPCKTAISGLYLANMTHLYPDERGINNSVRLAAEALKVMKINSGFVPINLSQVGQVGFS